jgi:hypothetical protein
MSKKTVIGRACKMAINASDDAWMFEGMKDEQDTDTTTEQRNGGVGKPAKHVLTEDVTYEEVGKNIPAQQEQKVKHTASQPQSEQLSPDGKIIGPGF